MEWWQVVVLGIVEGVTEFLPVSSTGHMILAHKVMGVENSSFVSSFEVIIQLGAILAIVVLMWRQLLNWHKWGRQILWALLPSVVVGALLYPLIKNVFLLSSELVVFNLFLGGVVMIWIERFWKNSEGETSLSMKKALLVGCGQALAVLPGVSRSMATIVTGRAVGLSRLAAVEFSFLLAVPTMILATGKDIWESGASYSQNEWLAILWGSVISFVVALVVVKLFLAFVKSRSMEVFGWYRIFLAMVFAVVWMMG